MTEQAEIIYDLDLYLTKTGYFCQNLSQSQKNREADNGDVAEIRNAVILLADGRPANLRVYSTCDPVTYKRISRKFRLSFLAGCSMVISLTINDRIFMNDLVGIEELTALISLDIRVPLVSLVGIEYAQNLETLYLNLLPSNLEMISGLGIKTLRIDECLEEDEDSLAQMKLDLPCLETLCIQENMIGMLQGLSAPLIKSVKICFPMIGYYEADEACENIGQVIVDEEPALASFLSRYPEKIITSDMLLMTGYNHEMVDPVLEFSFSPKNE